MFLIADGETNWMQVVSLLIVTAGGCVTAWIAYKQAQLNNAQREEALKATRREYKLDTLTQQTDEQTNMIRGQNRVLEETKQVAVEAKQEAAVAAKAAKEAKK